MKKTIVILIITTIVLFGNSNSYAAALEAKINVTPDKTEVEKGDSVVFTITISNIENAQDDLVTAIEGNIKYDTNFFENMTYTGITVNTNTGKFSKLDSFTNNSNIGTITLKVKSDGAGTGEVKFEGLKSDDGRDDYTGSTASTPDITYNITLKQKQSEDQEPSEGDEKTDKKTEEEENPSKDDEKTEEEKNPSKDDKKIEDGQESSKGDGKTEEEPKTSSTNLKINTTEKSDNTAATTVLPKTGNKCAISIILIATIILVVAYIKKRKYKEVR